MGCCVLLSVVHSPPLPHHLSPTLPPTSPARGRVIRTRGTGESPPPHPYPFGQFEAAAVDLEDGLKFGGHEYDG
jgi:hypothetical protein